MIKCEVRTMRDIPMFETEFGVAGLVLNQVPYTSSAYIHIMQTGNLSGLLSECVDFCRAVGADRVYACGDDALSRFPHHIDVLHMSRPIDGIETSTDCLFPVTDESWQRWRALYNERMIGVDNALILSERECKSLVKAGGAYFVHAESQLLGIGIASGERIDAIASLVPGGGARVLSTLCHALTGPMVNVEVASTNVRAIRLYERLGFLTNDIIRSWFSIL